MQFILWFVKSLKRKRHFKHPENENHKEVQCCDISCPTRALAKPRESNMVPLGTWEVEEVGMKVSIQEAETLSRPSNTAASAVATEVHIPTRI